ncbi:conserved hypothetical protein [uncultured Mycobacterium sp.]|uniref:Uncharacterized protein n=1 Tax=uncultured Mycobacterium sp. TaxID=171292 RepID=A0A1Y5PCJ5_9MYCO|nr:conserved hypothetical protein [uncultured Mycobacterium sp.]
MAEVTEKPDGLKSGNDLDNIPDDLLGGPPPPADIMLAGKILTTLASPPGPGETVELHIRVRVYDTGTAYGDNGEGEPSPYRKTKLVSCWLPGQPEPEPVKSKAELDAEAEAEAAENQPPLPYDPQTDPEIDRPGFSDGAL